MSRAIQFILFSIATFICSGPFAQTYIDPRATESDKISMSVIQHHINDSFYLQMRPLPSVRFETRNYIVMHDGRTWRASFSNRCHRDGCVIKSQKIKSKETDAATIAQNIDFKRLWELPISDSVKIDDPQLIGAPSYFIIVCSKGKVRKFEYPFNFHYDATNEPTFWQSNYLESVLKELEKLAENAKLKHR